MFFTSEPGSVLHSKWRRQNGRIQIGGDTNGRIQNGGDGIVVRLFLLPWQTKVARTDLSITIDVKKDSIVLAARAADQLLVVDFKAHRL